MNWPANLWFAVTVIFLIIEAVCPFHLVSIWFAIGSLVAMIVALFTNSLWLQGTLFLVVSCTLLALMIPLVKKYLRPRMETTNVDSVIGTQGYVTEPIDNLKATGQVKLGGMYWSARSSNDAPIAPDTLVQVDRVEGVKVFVTAVEKSSPLEKVNSL